MSPTPPVAARHHERPVRQFTLPESAQYFVHCPAREADYPHTSRSQPGFQVRGDCAADENPGPKAQKPSGLREWIGSRQQPLLPTDLLFTFKVDQQHISGDIKHGGYPALPLWNRDPHHCG
ncbi:MAG: hypothetical protein ACUVXB_15595 [Bryobacteraceae bacterium]